MELYCLLCGQKLVYSNEIDPDILGYNSPGIIGVYYCENHDEYNLRFNITDLEDSNGDSLERFITYEFEYNL